ncbi:HAMP domain-containing histidine kinase [bacterium SCSIO 12741]|nr:HAMP domain-containing histidine kinase [bacterium SCSIO 12741]
MSNQAIRGRIWLAIVALVGIIFLQGVWLKRAWEIHQRQLDHRLHSAMVGTAHQLEKEHFRLFMSEGRWDAMIPEVENRVQAFAGSSSGSGKMEIHNNIVIENLDDDGNEIRIEVIEDSDGGDDYIEKQVVISRDGTEQMRRSMRTRPRRQRMKFSQSGKRVKSFGRWMAYAEELAEEYLVTDSLLIANIQTIDVDSLLKREMRRERIKSPFAYAIVFAGDDSNHVVSQSYNYTTSFNNEADRVAILGHRKAEAPLELLVYLQQPSMNWPAGLVMMTLLSFLFTSAIIYAFWYTVRSLYNQKRLSDIKTDFINNMTHEFKTPISTISLAVDSIRHPKVKQDADLIDHYADVIKEENSRMNDQVERVLHLALLNKGRVPLKLEATDMHELIRHAAKAFDLLLEKKGGELVLNLQANPHHLIVDNEQVRHVLSNLLDNAIKYSPQNPRISVTTEVRGNNFQIAVSDQGMGMDRETLRRVFSRFYRAQSGNIQNVKGFGLGLSYVKSIVDLHQGSVRAESELGKGSTFYIEFPLNG